MTILNEGAKAPEFALPASNGKTVSLKDYVGKKVVVFEQHYLPGGWCHSFPLEGYLFSPGVHYIGALHEALTSWLEVVPASEPVGVLFSGGVDSGAVLLTLHQALLDRGDSPKRVKGGREPMLG